MTGQSWATALVDVAYWIVVCLLGKWRILDGQVIAALLSGYSAYRFGVAHSKQQTQAAANAATNASNRAMPAVIAAIAETPARADETFPPDDDRPSSGGTPAAPARNVPRRIPGSGPLVPPDAAGGPPDRRARRSMLFQSPLVQLVRTVIGGIRHA